MASGGRYPPPMISHEAGTAQIKGQRKVLRALFRRQADKARREFRVLRAMMSLIALAKT